jgi:hypothetical protein
MIRTRSPMAGLAALALALVLLALPWRAAYAQTRPDITVRVDASTVGVGDQIRVTMQASTEDGAITNAELVAPRTFSQVNASSGPTSSINIVNGRMSQRRGLNATWTLRADKTGSFDLGPASVLVNGKKVSSAKIHVTVVAAGHAPRPQPTDPFGSPFGAFDPFKGLFEPFSDPRQPQPQEILTDPKFALDAPRGSIAFLHATIDKTQAVVGEQVTLNVYLYQDLSEREPDSADVHEATASDFLRRSLFEDDATNRPAGNGLVGGRPWSVKLVRKSALFPLKTGDLEIGPMSLTLVRARAQGDPRRESETLHVRVTEPPVAGRPPGYRMGDVGNFNLSSDVTPHEIERDGAIGVTVDLSGTGNLPSNLVPPARAGIEWLPPETHEKMGATASDRFGGKRTFAFVVRLHKEGDIDLGSLTLPFWNPDTRSYGVAMATLGVVHVRRGATPATADTALDPLPGLPAVRATRTGSPPVRKHLPDSPVFWLGLGGAPLLYVAVAGVLQASQNIRRRRASRKSSPETELKERMLLADRACNNGNPNDEGGTQAAYAAIIRALQSATIARAGVNVRDARASEIARRLEEQGVGAETAARFEELLQACETARFAPQDAPEVGVAAQWREAKQAIGSLRRST